MRESKVQRDLRQGYEADGCVVLKLNPGPDIPLGFPDLLVVMPDGRVRFVEVKREKGRVSPAQEHWRDRLTRMGHDAMIVRPKEEK